MSEHSRQSRRKGLPALEILEQAIGVLRHSPGTLVLHYVGAVPFWLGLLYYMADMSRDAYAASEIGQSSLQIALLFIWMKCWQSAAANRLRASLRMEEALPWSIGRVVRIVARQSFYQPLGLIVRPVAVAVTLPYAWVSSFFQNVTVLDDGSAGTGAGLFERSIAQAKLWPGQQHALISFLYGFGICIWLNIVAALVVVPMCLNKFLGIQSVFTLSIEAYLNSTFVLATFALTCLCLEPIWKAAYVLRCFHGASVRTGGDLSVELKRMRPALRMIPVGVAFWIVAASSLAAAPEAAPVSPRVATGSSIDAGELKIRVGRVLEKREFAWRAPRQRAGESKESWASSWAKSVGQTIQGFVKKASVEIGKLVKWILERWMHKKLAEGDLAGENSKWKVQWLLWGSATIVVVGLTWILVRTLRRRRHEPVSAQSVAVTPDLLAEDVSADALPEEEWLKLAREYAAAGQFQLALRAGWLACLAHLGRRDLLRIAPYKSNRDYREELRRRARNRDQLLGAFGQNFLMFERVWYGCHEVNAGAFEQFTENLEVIRRC